MRMMPIINFDTENGFLGSESISSISSDTSDSVDSAVTLTKTADTNVRRIIPGAIMDGQDPEFSVSGESSETQPSIELGPNKRIKYGTCFHRCAIDYNYHVFKSKLDIITNLHKLNVYIYVYVNVYNIKLNPNLNLHIHPIFNPNTNKRSKHFLRRDIENHQNRNRSPSLNSRHRPHHSPHFLPPPPSPQGTKLLAATLSCSHQPNNRLVNARTNDPQEPRDKITPADGHTNAARVTNTSEESERKRTIGAKFTLAKWPRLACRARNRNRGPSESAQRGRGSNEGVEAAGTHAL
ncbi:unnamed protein product [Penicillium bialowiezense]